jgi:hypothetical protein
VETGVDGETKKHSASSMINDEPITETLNHDHDND